MSMPTSICTGPKGLAVYRNVELYFLINQKVTWNQSRLGLGLCLLNPALPDPPPSSPWPLLWPHPRSPSRHCLQLPLRPSLAAVAAASSAAVVAPSLWFSSLQADAQTSVRVVW
jgi:hypothetical protein